MNIPARFEAKIVRVPFCGCWIWTGSGERYGYVWVNGKCERAHRAVFKLAGHFLTDEQHMLHRCDIGFCVNPDHLFVGTHADNMADMASKGRSRAPSGANHWTRINTEKARLVARKNIARAHGSGVANNNAKASPEVAAQIRAANAAMPHVAMSDLGRQFGLGREQTRKIVKEIAWKS